jgi:hypothetical protein
MVVLLNPADRSVRIKAPGKDTGTKRPVSLLSLAITSSNNQQGRPTMAAEPMAPGDDAPPGTPGTGEDICPKCSGTGKLNDKPCPNCAGTGRIVEGVGGG